MVLPLLSCVLGVSLFCVSLLTAWSRYFACCCSREGGKEKKVAVQAHRN